MPGQDDVGGAEERIGGEAVPVREGGQDLLGQADDLVQDFDV